MTPTTQERGADTSASNAQADQLCAGRHLYQRGCPDVKTTDSSHGTEVHEALKKQDPTGLKLVQAETYDACSQIEKKMLEKYFGAGADLTKLVTIRERRYWVKWKDGLQHSGMIDVVHLLGVKAIIFDYKSLNGEVAESPKNLQLRDEVCLYAAGNPMLSEVAVCPIQPLVTWSPELCVYNRADINKSTGLMYQRVKDSNDPNAKRTPGEVQCKWCLAKSKCDEYAKWEGKSLPVSVISLDVPVAQWTPQQCALFLERKPMAQKWLDDCNDAMKKLLAADPESIPGFALKPGAKRETITNPQGVFDRFSSKGGSLEQFMKCIVVAKTKLKEQLATVTSLKGKKLTDELAGLTAGMVEVKENEPSIERKD